MIVICDSEGDPVQEFSALYVDEESALIKDVFHRHVRYPFFRDKDTFARSHIHGLNLHYLQQHGLNNASQLVTLFHQWLSSHPYKAIFAHGPQREVKLLSLPIYDVHLPPWTCRVNMAAHRIARRMKVNNLKICNVSCFQAHSDFLGWLPKNVNNPSSTDYAKIPFSHHCSLYDCIECYAFLFHDKIKNKISCYFVTFSLFS